MKPPDSVFLDRDSVDRGDLDFRGLERALPDLVSWGSTAPDETLDRIREARVVISNKVMIDGPTIEACSRLELVLIAATGTNNVDLDAASRRGVAVCNVRNYATSSVAQHVFALVLLLARSIEPYANSVRTGRWNESPFFCLLDHPITDLEGRTLGIIGYGTLGSAVARIGEAFGMKVLKGARPGMPSAADRVALPDLYREADVISLHCPLTGQTRNLIDAGVLSAMKPDAILINTARGGIVDEHALARALKNRWIGGAGIDVLETEPPDGTSPLLAEPLPNLIVTPHNAWASTRCRQILVDQLTKIVRDHKTGILTNRVA